MIKVSTPEMENAAARERELSGNMAQIASRLRTVNSRLTWSIGGFGSIHNSIQAQAENVTRCSTSMQRMQSVLTSSKDRYTRTETSLSGQTGVIGWKGGISPGDIVKDIIRNQWPKDWTKRKWEHILPPVIGIFGPPKTPGEWILDKLKYVLLPSDKDANYKTSGKNPKGTIWKEDIDNPNQKTFKEHNKDDLTKVKPTLVWGKGVSASSSAWGKEWLTGDEDGTYTKNTVDVWKREAYANAYGGMFQVGKDGKKYFAPGIGAAAGYTLTAFTASHEDRIGNDMLGIKTKTQVDVGRVGASGEVAVGLTNKDGKFDPSFYGGVKAEAIAGEISGTVTGEIAGADVSVKASVNYGVGAHADVGYHDGKLSLDVGASLGVGGGVKLEVDISGTVDVVKDAAKAAWKKIKFW